MSASAHLVAQSCLTLCDPLDYSPPGSSVHRISQAKILQWVAISLHHLKILCGLTGLGQEIGIQVTGGTNVNQLVSSLTLKLRLVASGFALEIGIMKDMEEPG